MISSVAVVPTPSCGTRLRLSSIVDNAKNRFKILSHTLENRLRGVFDKTLKNYEVQIDNEHVHVARAKILPHQEIGLHRDECPQVVVALRGGTITRLEANGTKLDVNFPKGIAVFRNVDPPNELHRSVNNSSKPVELIIIKLKNGV